jgi:hypothetical protein
LPFHPLRLIEAFHSLAIDSINLGAFHTYGWALKKLGALSWSIGGTLSYASVANPLWEPKIKGTKFGDRGSPPLSLQFEFFVRQRAN